VILASVVFSDTTPEPTTPVLNMFNKLLDRPDNPRVFCKS